MANPTAGLAADILSASLEKVSTRLPELLETTDTVASMIKKSAEAVKISDKCYRIPLLKSRGGVAGAFDPDTGTLHTGTGPKTINLTAGYKYTDIAFELSMREIDTTATSEQAVLNAFKYSLNNAMGEYNVYDDIWFHQDGTGVLTGRASANSTWTSGDTLTFAGTTDYVGVKRLRPGMAVQVFTYDYSAARTVATDPIIIDHIDYDNKVVYFLGAITGETSGATGDVLVVPGVTATATSFSSSWPLSGDSFRHGLYYAHDITGTNYYLGKLKSDNTELIPSTVNASSSAISFAHVQAMLDKLVMRRNESAYKGLIGLADMKQRAKVQDIGVSISEWFRQPGQQKMPDLQPENVGYTSTFQMCGLTIYTDKRQDQSRIDFINPKNWFRAVVREPGFLEVGGRRIFEGRTTGGAQTVSQFFHIVSGFDYGAFDPGAESYLYGLSVA
jgi:hypothetical protein